MDMPGGANEFIEMVLVVLAALAIVGGVVVFGAMWAWEKVKTYAKSKGE